MLLWKLQNRLLPLIEYCKNTELSISKRSWDTCSCSVISSKLFFCNSLLYGLQRSVLDRLQYVQNCAVRLVLRTRSSEHITPVLRQLHWLPIKQLIAYKILLLTYKAMNSMAPKYIVDLLERFTPKSQLRSSSNNINLLVIQKSNLKSFGDRSFRVAAPRLWNVLPNSTRLIQYLDVFKNK